MMSVTATRKFNSVDCKKLHTKRATMPHTPMTALRKEGGVFFRSGSTEAGVVSLILYSHIVAMRARVTIGPRNLPIQNIIIMRTDSKIWEEKREGHKKAPDSRDTNKGGIRKSRGLRKKSSSCY